MKVRGRKILEKLRQVKLKLSSRHKRQHNEERQRHYRNEGMKSRGERRLEKLRQKPYEVLRENYSLEVDVRGSPMKTAILQKCEKGGTELERCTRERRSVG